MPSSIHGRFASSHMYMYSYSMLGNWPVVASKDMLTRHLPMPEVHSTCNNGQFFSWLVFWLVRVIWVMPLSMKTSLAILPVLPSPPTRLTLASYLCIQGGHLHSICHLLLSHLLLNSNKKVMEASSALYFLDHHTPIQIVAKPIVTLDTVLVYLIIYWPLAKPPLS